MSQPNTGLVQSLQARIVNRAKGLGVEPTLLFTRFGLERFLYRLSKSAYAERFVLKGALMMLVWAGESVRATRDADLLGFGEITPERLEEIFREIAVLPCDPDDGVVFLPETVAAAAIRESDQYGGQRVRVEGRLGTVKLSLQFDVGVGDAVYPPPEWLEYPSLLDIPRPMLRTYQSETSIAEKLHAMVDLGESNTRMKDYFDVATLATIRDFDGIALGRAIRETFERRNTPIVATPAGLTSRFGRDAGKQRQWEAFVSKSRIDASLEFEAWVLRVALFASPVLSMLLRKEEFAGSWPAGGPWWIPGGKQGR
jgi:hypothetical protein